MQKNLNVLFIFLLVIISFNFFEARFLNKNLNLYFRFFYIFLAISLSVPFLFPKREGFVFPIQLMAISMMVSIFMAHFSWGQGIKDSVVATVPYMLWFFFFYLLKTKIPISTIESIILIYGIIYCLLYFYQYTHPGNPLFGSQEEFKEDRGVIRIIFPGGGIFYLCVFMAINKLTTRTKNLWLWFAVSFVGLVFCILQVTRQSIFALLLIYFYHFTKVLSLGQRIMLVGFIAILFFLIKYSDNPLVRGLAQAQKSAMQEGKQNIRFVAATYFITDFSPNVVTRILGNGVPYAEATSYALYVVSLQGQGFYLADVGIVAMYVMFGILSVIAYLLIWYKGFTASVPKEYYYLKYYLLYLLITSVTSNYVYDLQYLIATVFVLYIYQRVYPSKNEDTPHSLG